MSMLVLCPGMLMPCPGMLMLCPAVLMPCPRVMIPCPRDADAVSRVMMPCPRDADALCVPAVLRGGPLTEPYRLRQLHLHWGSSDLHGSEHIIDGVRHAAEVRQVFNQRSVLAAILHLNTLTMLPLESI